MLNIDYLVNKLKPKNTLDFTKLAKLNSDNILFTNFILNIIDNNKLIFLTIFIFKIIKKY